MRRLSHELGKKMDALAIGGLGRFRQLGPGDVALEKIGDRFASGRGRNLGVITNADNVVLGRVGPLALVTRRRHLQHFERRSH